MIQLSRKALLLSLFEYGVVFLIIWLLLTRAEWRSLILGVPAILAAVFCKKWLFPRMSLARTQITAPTTKPPLFIPYRLLGFTPFFLWQSLKGGWDSALFALLPHKTINPGYLTFTTRIPDGAPRHYLIHTITMLPGTVSVSYTGGDILIHALDCNDTHIESLQQCEQRVAKLFGLSLEEIKSTADKRSPPNL